MKRDKKILGLLLAVILIVSLAACGGNTGSNASNPATSANAVTEESSPATDILSPYAPYPETITLSIGKVLYADPKFPEGQDSRKNLILDLLKERLNIEFNVLWEVDQKEYKNKLGLSIASGEMPDMVEISGDDYLTFRQLAENGALADLTEAYDKCSGDYMKKIMQSFVGNKFEPITIGGKLYAYPNMGLGFNQNLLWVRNDWLKKVGLPAPKTVEDIKTVAKAFIDQDPGGNGAGKTVGMVLNSTLPLGNYSNYLGAESIANSVGAYPRQWMKDANGNVYYGSVAPEMKTALGILSDMYKGGLIDKSFLTRKSASEAEAIVKDNRCGMFFSAWWAGWPLYDLVKTHPEADWLALNAPLDSEGKYKHNAPATTDYLLVMSKNCKYPEAMIKILNVEFDAWRGFDADAKAKIQPFRDLGTSFQAANPTGDINLDYYDVLPRLGHKVKDYAETGKIEWDESASDYDKQVAEDAKNYAAKQDTNNQNAWIAWYTRVVASTNLDAPENLEVKQAYSYSTESMPDIKPALDTLEDATVLQIITGDKPLDYFDEFVAQWKKAGGDKLTQEVQEIVK